MDVTSKSPTASASALGGFVVAVVPPIQDEINAAFWRSKKENVKKRMTRESLDAWAEVETDLAAIHRYDEIRDLISSQLRGHRHRINSTPQMLCSAALLLHDRSRKSLRYWCPASNDETIMKRLGPPYIYPCVINGTRLTPGLGNLELPVDDLIQHSKVIGKALHSQNIIHSDRLLSRERSDVGFDALAGFMSVLCIPMPVKCEQDTERPIQGQLSGILVLTSPLAAFFGCVAGDEPCVPRRAVIRKIGRVIDKKLLREVFRIMQEAHEAARQERVNLILARLHGMGSRMRNALNGVKEIRKELSSSIPAEQLRSLCRAEEHLTSIYGQLTEEPHVGQGDSLNVVKALQFDFGDAVENWCRNLQTSAASDCIELRCTSEKVLIEGDRARLQTAWDFLMENAMQAARRHDGGKGNRKIDVTVKQRETSCLVTIENTGPRISERVLASFQRAICNPGMHCLTTSPSGSGMGLVYAYRILLAHGSDYGPTGYALSGTGTTVLTFCLPLVQPKHART